MATTKLLDTATAATEKGCSRQAILGAIRNSKIDGEQLGRYYAVRANRKFEDWQPDPTRQQIGRESQRPRRQTKKAKAKRK
jgi:hypothetical protein